MAIIGPLPALVLAGFAAVAMSGCAVSLDVSDDTTRRIEEDTIPLGDLNALDVTTDNGQVEIVAGNVTAVELRAVLVESDAGDASFTVAETAGDDGGRLVVDGECDGGWLDRCSVGFRLIVPEHFDVTVHTDNGRVGIDGITGDVDITTDNGAIDADDLGSTTAIAQTDNGRIELSFTDAPTDVDAETDNGQIVVRVPEGADYDVSADSDNGAVEIDVTDAPSADRTIRAKTDNGAIDVEYVRT